MNELLVVVSMRFRSDIDQYMLSALLAPVVRAAVAAGGLTTNLSVQPYEDWTDASPEEATVPASAVHTGEDKASSDPLASDRGTLRVADAQGDLRRAMEA